MICVTRSLRSLCIWRNRWTLLRVDSLVCLMHSESIQVIQSWIPWVDVRSLRSGPDPDHPKGTHPYSPPPPAPRFRLLAHFFVCPKQIKVHGAGYVWEADIMVNWCLKKYVPVSVYKTPVCISHTQHSAWCVTFWVYKTVIESPELCFSLKKLVTKHYIKYIWIMDAIHNEFNF